MTRSLATGECSHVKLATGYALTWISAAVFTVMTAAIATFYVWMERLFHA